MAKKQLTFIDPYISPMKFLMKRDRVLRSTLQDAAILV